MSTTVHEIAPDIYRIATTIPEAPVSFIQFLIKDEKPLLFHTGSRAYFDQTLEAVKRLIDPGDLRYISWSHLEGDECGALNEFLAAAPNAEPVQGALGVQSGADFVSRPIRAMGDGEVLDLGEKRFRFLITPHVPHCWDAIMAFEETTGALFCSDLFTSFGEAPAVTDSDIVGPALATFAALPDYMPIGPHTGRVFDRLEALAPKTIAGHHSSTYNGDAVQALRDLKGEMFKLAGMPG